LEFDDVILYNFFSEKTSVNISQWNSVLHHIKYDENMMTRDEYEN